MSVGVSWCQAGDGTLAERLAMFQQQKLAVEQQIHDSLLNLRKVNHKIDVYQRAVAAGSEGLVDCDALPQLSADELLAQVKAYEVAQKL
ncbi:MerR family transcriptional regulator [Lactiplantibacillus songbeiensis]|uniref:Uncharacterized protein n=1 Tax=Lactiplantibacillus songbeiensis TaxID=2559920 RepID=A0ABW4C1K6_9LACO|nr:hypothetical protein [Lactiplantibacillus songbeiensis]